MNLMDNIVYVTLDILKDTKQDNTEKFHQIINQLKEDSKNSNFLIIDTLQLSDLNHDGFINCAFKIDDQELIPIIKDKTAPWITKLGKLELKRLSNDYQAE